MYINRPKETLFMHRHYLGQVIQYWDLTAERYLYIKYGEFHNFLLVGHLGLRFQNEAMYINGPLQKLFMSMHVHLKSLTPEIWLLKSLYMLSMENSLNSCRSAILDQDFKMRLCTSMDHYIHCSWVGMSISSHSLLRCGCGKVSICQAWGIP